MSCVLFLNSVSKSYVLKLTFSQAVRFAFFSDSLPHRTFLEGRGHLQSPRSCEVNVTVAQLCPTPCDPMDYIYSPWNSPGQNTGVGSQSRLQGTSPTQGSNPGLPHCRTILYQLSHQGSSRILESVAYPFSSRSFWPRNQTGVSCIAGSLPAELPGKPINHSGPEILYE